MNIPEDIYPPLSQAFICRYSCIAEYAVPGYEEYFSTFQVDMADSRVPERVSAESEPMSSGVLLARINLTSYIFALFRPLPAWMGRSAMRELLELCSQQASVQWPACELSWDGSTNSLGRRRSRNNLVCKAPVMVTFLGQADVHVHAPCPLGAFKLTRRYDRLIIRLCIPCGQQPGS